MPIMVLRLLLRFRNLTEFGVGDKALAIGHFDRWQGVPVERSIRRKDSIQVEDVSRNCVGVIDAKRAGRLVRHCPMNVVEQSRGVRPVAAYSLDGIFGRQAALSTRETILYAALAIGPMASLAILFVH